MSLGRRRAVESVRRTRPPVDHFGTGASTATVNKACPCFPLRLLMCPAVSPGFRWRFPQRKARLTHVGRPPGASITVNWARQWHLGGIFGVLRWAPSGPCSQPRAVGKFDSALDIDLTSGLQDGNMQNQAQQPKPRDGSAPCQRPAIEAVGLDKSFGGHVALRGLDLAIPEGSVTALIGPNGSGKTTTVRILSTLLGPDAGRATVFGHDVVTEPEAVRAVIGVTGQFSAVDKLLTGTENLVLMARLLHLARPSARERIAMNLERFELTDAADRPVATYSGGMRRRLDLAMTLMGDPRIVFLDEPTSGLDPRGRRVLWRIVRGLVADGMTVLLTTQYLEEADHLADRVVLIDRGALVAEGTPTELKQRAPGGRIRLQFIDDAALVAAGAQFQGATLNADNLSLELVSDGKAAGIRSVLDRLERHGITTESFLAQPPDLDDVFFALTGSSRATSEATTTEVVK